MGKLAISVTLEPDNLAWLRGRARAATRSISETIDRLIVSARKGGVPGETRSIVGTVSIAAEDPDLVTADQAARGIIARSLGFETRAQKREAKSRRPRQSRG